MLRTLLALALLGCAHALIAAPLAARPLAARAAEPMTMKHKDYFKRLKRSEDGRLRLCVSRCVGSPPRRKIAAAHRGSLPWLPHNRRARAAAPRCPPPRPRPPPPRAAALLLTRPPPPSPRAGATTTSTPR